jgi:hypothetical protein
MTPTSVVRMPTAMMTLLAAVLAIPNARAPLAAGRS